MISQRPTMTATIRSSLSKLKVHRQVIDVALIVFPGEAFEPLMDAVRDAATSPPRLGLLLTTIPPRIGVGFTSHTLITMRHMLELGPGSFSRLTRDYVRRCCDVVEISLKARAFSNGFIRQGDKRPLGPIIRLLEEQEALPVALIQALSEFNAKIYARAKHEVTRQIVSHKFTTADAAVITVVAMKLSDEIHNAFRNRMRIR